MAKIQTQVCATTWKLQTRLRRCAEAVPDSTLAGRLSGTKNSHIASCDSKTVPLLISCWFEVTVCPLASHACVGWLCAQVPSTPVACLSTSRRHIHRHRRRAGWRHQWKSDGSCETCRRRRAANERGLQATAPTHRCMRAASARTHTKSDATRRNAMGPDRTGRDRTKPDGPDGRGTERERM